MTQRMFLVDVEATSPTPYSGAMTEFAVVDFTSRAWFHAHLFDFVPTPGRPALPMLVTDEPNPGYTLSENPESRVACITDAEVYQRLDRWLNDAAGTDRPVLVSDNPAFDFMWVAYGFDSVGLANPFGFTGRRIGDLAAGLSGKWRNTSAWKRHRRTTHDHNPVNDALGNAEALHEVLSRAGQLEA